MTESVIMLNVLFLNPYFVFKIPIKNNYNVCNHSGSLHYRMNKLEGYLAGHSIKFYSSSISSVTLN